MTIDLEQAGSTGAAVAVAPAPVALDLERVGAFAERVSADHGIALNAMLAYVGDRLGLWQGLAAGGAVTSSQLAERTGLAERYVREWLAAQASAGYVEHDRATGRFVLPAEHAAVLATPGGPADLTAPYELLAALWSDVDLLAHAFTTGEGIGWHEHDPRVATAVARYFRPLYEASLLTQWVPAVDGLAEVLTRGARVLDVGAGLGVATLLLAGAFPASTFVGIDSHEDSVRRARAAAAEAGLDGRVAFEVTDAAVLDDGVVDVACFFDALHDLGDPLGVLRRVRAQMAPGGTLFVVEPGAEDSLADNLGPQALAWYASSAALCVPGSLAQEGRAALGAQAGARRLVELITEAGFRDARLDARTPFNLVLSAQA